MAISYHIYANSDPAGPVDYSTPVGTVAGLTWDSPALAAPSDNRFAVRAFDTITGHEESNLDAVVRIVIDADGNDVTNLPHAPQTLTAVSTASGGVRVEWVYPRSAGLPNRPAGFHVYVGSPTPNYGTVAATVPYLDTSRFGASLSGLTDGLIYQVGVRAYNATGEEVNTTTAEFTADATGPLAVEGLTSELTAQG